ncbi:Na+/H+ antiporter subunit E [Hyphomicrobium sp. CS1BSMeth3]|uniref:Na+/H+ antiporter subunit E n=1 Tax=Hyphomicrobium sp. CS1BSMeth3 TaxID=1892844 RepID=UPI0009303B70|nr:Na+/H+ antiporter subunit E [Hyphomicrobium sp. CS1BSMeth3]
MRVISFGVILYLFWLALSGYFKPFLLIGGLICTLFVLYASRRMKLIDTEGYPAHLFPAASTYWPWLLWEIIKSGWNVTKVILRPRLSISPAMTRLVASQHSAAGIATYANSITLTPGTITTGAKGNILTVHALERGGALDLEEGGMDARVTRFERGG